MKVYEFNETLRKYDPDDEIYLVVNREGIIERITIESVDKYCRNPEIEGGRQWIKSGDFARAALDKCLNTAGNSGVIVTALARYTDQFLGITGVAPRKETNDEQKQDL